MVSHAIIKAVLPAFSKNIIIYEQTEVTTKLMLHLMSLGGHVLYA